MNKGFFAVIIVGLTAVAICATGCITNVSNPTVTLSPTSSSPNLGSSYVPPTFPGYLNYTNKVVGIAIQYPASWKAFEREAGDPSVVMFSYNMNRTYLSVYAEDKATNSLVGSGYDSLVKGLQRYWPEFTLLNSTNTTLSGNPAHSIVYTATDNTTVSAFLTGTPTPMKIMTVWTWKNQIEYRIEYVSFADQYQTHLESAQNMIQSFNIIG